ncbi:polysaccharide export protein [bacterium]|jgi:polysaccharide export outer membrane protein|nr:polysaccharide export protein [bacterium]
MTLRLRYLARLCLAWACLLGLTSLAADQPSAPAPAAPEAAPSRPSYRLRARDTIRVGVINEADTLVERRINPDGTIDIPFLKENVKVGGLTVSEAQAAIEKLFLRYFKRPQVVLTIVTYAERRVYVNGFVGKPGSVLVPPEETLTLGRALSLAGGILARGSRTDVTVTRSLDGVPTPIQKDMSKIDKGQEPDFPLEDEDQIYVRDRTF